LTRSLLDPPWGGVDYEVFGKTGYDLARTCTFNDPNNHFQQHRVPLVAATASTAAFDSFQSTPRNKQKKGAVQQ
jgi:hypothetical protein